MHVSFFAPPEETDQAVKNVRHCPVACNYCRIQRTQIHPTVGCVGIKLFFIHTLRTHYKSSDALDRSECESPMSRSMSSRESCDRPSLTLSPLQRA